MSQSPSYCLFGWTCIRMVKDWFEFGRNFYLGTCLFVDFLRPQRQKPKQRQRPRLRQMMTTTATMMSQSPSYCLFGWTCIRMVKDWFEFGRNFNLGTYLFLDFLRPQRPKPKLRQRPKLPQMMTTTATMMSLSPSYCLFWWTCIRMVKDWFEFGRNFYLGTCLFVDFLRPQRPKPKQRQRPRLPQMMTTTVTMMSQPPSYCLFGWTCIRMVKDWFEFGRNFNLGTYLFLDFLRPQRPKPNQRQRPRL